MDEADRVHPCDGAAELGPYPADRGFREGGPCGVAVDEREQVAACEVGEDERVVRRGSESAEKSGDVWVGDVLVTWM